MCTCVFEMIILGSLVDEWRSSAWPDGSGRPMARLMSSNCACSCRPLPMYSLRNSVALMSKVSLVIHLLPATSCLAAAAIITWTRFSESCVASSAVPPLPSATPCVTAFSRIANSMCCRPCCWMCSRSALLRLTCSFSDATTSLMLPKSAYRACIVATCSGAASLPTASNTYLGLALVGEELFSQRALSFSLGSAIASTRFSMSMILSSRFRTMRFRMVFRSAPLEFCSIALLSRELLSSL
mmetsp:Transcript_40976/g.108258  ORF Transcript_40976/g.108258 Transcript_40976/m.108258 type:complete len:241 (+) Transcript_40976:160-882(+)